MSVSPALDPELEAGLRRLRLRAMRELAPELLASRRFHPLPIRARCVAVRAQPKPSPEGIVLRHRRRCATESGGGCTCRPGFQAQVYSPGERRTIRKTFRSLSDARAWRAQTTVAVGQGTLRAPTRITLAEAAEAWLESAESGVIRTRSGDRYKPSALRAYRLAIEGKRLNTGPPVPV